MLEFLIVVAAVIADRVSKYLVKIYLKPLSDGTYPLINGVFHLTYVENRGAAFSILQNQRWLFIIITIAAVIFITYYLAVHRNEKVLLRVAMSMILGGAIGNLIDRIRLGYVVDFFDFRAINFAVFNVADSFVTVGSVLLIIYLLFFAEKQN